MAKHKNSDPAADELPAAPPDAAAAEETPETPDSTQKTQPSPPVAGDTPVEAGTAAESPAEIPPATEKSHAALYHFEDGNGLHAVPCEAIPEEGGGYTIVRDGIPVVTGAPASAEPKSGHVIL